MSTTDTLSRALFGTGIQSENPTVIAEFGGRIEDLDGGPLNLGPGLANVLATNGRIHELVIEIVRDDQERRRA